ncbi:DoxX family protein [Curtobacterium sp. SP.BCp]|uniref:DoxX family protein n=1 Tax=Curtobacterium sp. SP.BCp TaxID=3435230 RepID=UPI003F7382FF
MRSFLRVLLGLFLVFAGVSHLTFAREDFRAQVPESLPLDTDAVVLGSGVAEIGLGSALLLAPRSSRRRVGTIAAWFFVAVFPGNVAQWLNRRSAFGLDTDAKRIGRLFGQPLLIAAALWSTRGQRSASVSRSGS